MFLNGDLMVGLSGLAIFLFSLRFLTQALDRPLSQKVAPILKLGTTGPLRPFFIGSALTLLVQASSITILTTMGLLARGLMPLEKAIYLTLGATLGTSVKAWFFTIDLTVIAPILIIFPSFFLLFVKEQLQRKMLELVFAIGLMFLGWKMLGEAFTPLVESAEVTALLQSTHSSGLANLLSAMALGLALALVVQSSSTVVFLVIGLAQTGLIPFIPGVAIILGANIGTTFTELLACLEYQHQVKRLALAHFLVKFLGALVAFLLLKTFLTSLDLLFMGQLSTLDVSTQLAATHFGFNLINSLVWLPLTPFLVKILEILIKGPRPKEKRRILTSNVQNLMIQVPQETMLELGHYWRDLKDQVKALEDEVFQCLKLGEHIVLTSSPRELITEIQSLEEVILSLMMRESQFQKQATDHLNHFGHLKLIVNDLLELQNLFDSLPKRKLKYLAQIMELHMQSVSEKRDRVWHAIITGEAVETHKINQRLIQKLQDQMIYACGHHHSTTQKDLFLIYRAVNMVLGHLQRLISLTNENFEQAHSTPRTQFSENSRTFLTSPL